MGRPVGQLSDTSCCCATSVALSAAWGVAKAAQKASPTVLNTNPRWPSMTARMISSWRRSAAVIAFGSSSHSLVEPSTSVNSSVTVPDGA